MNSWSVSSYWIGGREVSEYLKEPVTELHKFVEFNTPCPFVERRGSGFAFPLLVCFWYLIFNLFPVGFTCTKPIWLVEAAIHCVH